MLRFAPWISFQRPAPSPLHPFPPARRARTRRRAAAAMLECAVRVPDHGKLVPWRFLAIRGEARAALGEIARRAQPGARTPTPRRPWSRRTACVSAMRRWSGRDRAGSRRATRCRSRSSCCPGGAVCFALLQAADALGFGAQWLTGWAAYDPVVAARAGPDGERARPRLHPHRHRRRSASRSASAPTPTALLTRAARREPQPGLPGRLEHVRVPGLAFDAGRVPGRTTASRSTPCTASPASCSN